VSTSTPLAPPRQDDGDGLAPAAAPGAELEDADRPARAVVVGADGTETSLRAVRWAAEDAVRRGAPLRIVHAAPYLSRPPGTGTPPPELPRARRLAGQAYTVARHTARAVQATAEVVPDEPADALLRAAAAGQLVVLGIATTGAADELILAPVAQRVAARSPQPVVVVPRRTGGEPTGRPIVAVLGLGEPEDDEPVVAFAAAAALRAGVPLSIVQTRFHRTASGNYVRDPDRWPERFPEVEMRHTELPRVTPGQLLGATCPTPLVVLSAGHGSFLHRTLDGPHRWLLRHCTSPMALVPPVHRPELEEREDAVAAG
jgi:nucleotide-binding universal stress UspA family protein